MIHVLRCILLQHDLRLVALAVLLSLFASVTAMTMIARGRRTRGRQRRFWVVIGGVVAGCGIWGLHFVAMLAYRFAFPVGYDVGLTALSALVAAVLCAVGFRVALSRLGGVAGGIITGVAICMMHYIGMAAIRAPATMVMDPHYVIASLVIGIGLSALALHIAIRRDSIGGYALAAGIFVFATGGMHFTAMSAATFVPNGAPPVSGVLDPMVLAVAVAASVVLVMALGLIGAIVDRHLAGRASREAERLRDHVAELERTKLELQETSATLSEALSAASAASQAKSLFLATMSHELRTPLNAIIGFAEILDAEMFGPLGHERYREYVGDIRKSGAHLLELINDILDLTRLDTAKLIMQDEQVDLPRLIDNVMRIMAGPAANAEICLTHEGKTADLALRADLVRMRQVLINLVSNAIKFTPAGGSVVLEAERDGDGLLLRIRDSGIGIAPEDVTRALEPFGQVDASLARKYEGSGLGLPLAKRLIELHGGTLELTSTTGQGTTVTIRLPAERVIETGAGGAKAVA